jgi:hypothetical protein
MPGKFVDEVLIYQCGTHADGSAVMCSKIGFAKIPFLLKADAPAPDDPSEADIAVGVGWQEPGSSEVHISLPGLVAAMKAHGIEMSYDKEELTRQLGPRPSSE